MGILLVMIVNQLKVYHLEPIVITGSRIPTELAYLTRKVTIISEGEIKSMPVHSVNELLNYLIDVRQRNTYGVQADVSIRGCSFEQVLILIDGVTISDPQTGHHNLDIPLTLGDIERIEVLRGHGSSIYGANGVGGVINIVTKSNFLDPSKITVGASYGSYKTYTTNLSNVTQLRGLTNRLSIEKQKSGGYREDTDFDNKILYFSSTFKNLANVSLGYVDKDFGAYRFYGPYPSKEHTTTKFVSISMNSNKWLKIQPKIHYREHYDEFILIRGKPNFYTNYHTNYRYGADITCYLGNAVFGGEAIHERISSKGVRTGTKVAALGERARQNAAIYAEYRKRYKDLLTNIGSRVDYNYGRYLSSSLSAGYLFSDKIKLRSSIGKSFRAPSFTELYYKDPGNVGDSTLKAEEGWSYEVGVDYQTWSSVTIFMRKENNLIDWVMIPNSSMVWYAKNIKKTTTKGIEADFELRSIASSFSLGYTFIYMNSELPPNYISKYVLNYPQHQLSGRMSHDFHNGWQGMVGFVIKQRINIGRYFIVDSQLARKIGRFSFLVKGTNLFNERYEEIPMVEMPGRWVTTEIKIEL